MSHREFKIINSRGETFDLMDKEALFITPSGLGFSKTLESERAGSFYVPTEEFVNQAVIPGQMAFKGYAPYTRFINFIKYTPLTLLYKPEGQWFKRAVIITNLSKGEVDNYGLRLYCDIDFTCPAGWYTDKSASATIYDVETENPKEYPYSYDYKYHGTASGTTQLAITDDGTPVKVTFYGPVVNPEYVVYNAGQRVGSGRFNCTVGEGEALIIDSNPLTMRAVIIDEQTGEIKRNAYRFGDLSTERFVYLPKGINTFAIGCYGSTEGFTALVEVQDYADTV